MSRPRNSDYNLALEGPEGPPGEVGPEGAQGIPGPPGEVGPGGKQGTFGPIGATGQTGISGPTGVAGAVGPIGPTGPSGPTGQAGPTGIQGIQGPQGTSGLIFLATTVRILDDSVARAIDYTNSAVQVSGVGGLPASLKTVWVRATIFTTASVPIALIMESPDAATKTRYAFSGNTLSGYGVFAMAHIVPVPLSATGKLSYQIKYSGYSRMTLDVLGYQV